MSARAWAMFVALCVIWGIPYLLIKVAVADVTPAALVFARTAIGAALLLPIAIARGELRPALRRWRWVVVFTVVEIAVPWVLLSDAERRLPSALVGLVIAAVPVVAALLAAVVGQERLEPRRSLGLLIGFVGVGAMLGLSGGTVGLRSIVELAAVVVGYAGAPLIVARKLQDVPSIGVVAISLSLCALGYALPAFLALPTHVGAAALGSLVILGVVCTASAFLIAFALIAEAGPVRATVITYVNPAVAAVLGVAVLGERLTGGMLAGFALILVGSVVATRRQGAAVTAATG